MRYSPSKRCSSSSEHAEKASPPWGRKYRLKMETNSAMSKLLTAISFAAVTAIALPTQAATVHTLTFDDVPNLTVIDNEYNAASGPLAQGILFSGSLAEVHLGTDNPPFNNVFTFNTGANKQFVHFNTQTVNATVSLTTPGAVGVGFSVQHRRPSNSQNITISLLNDSNVEVAKYFGLSTSTVQTFTYDGSNGGFTKVNFSATNKFSIDNLTITTVPLPAAVFLMAGALPLLASRRRRA